MINRRDIARGLSMGVSLGLMALISSVSYQRQRSSARGIEPEQTRESAPVYGPRESIPAFLEDNSRELKQRAPVFRLGPVYDEARVPSRNCSRYIRFAAKDLFNLEYPAADAWDLRDFSSVVHTPVSGADDVRHKALHGTFVPGDVLAVYNPSSVYNSNSEARKAGYTHVLLYLGQDAQGELRFADKFGSRTRTNISLHEVTTDKLKPVETLHLKNRSKK